MKFDFSSRKTLHSTNLAISILAFVFGFMVSYHQGRIRVSEAGLLAWNHLVYILELKDDMAVIDWSRSLESFGDILAFQSLVNSKVVAEGGNRNYLSKVTKEGATYWFPRRWIFYECSKKDPLNQKEFTLVYQTSPGPVLWGLLFFTVCFLTGNLAGRLTVLAVREKVSPSIPRIANPKPVLPVVLPAGTSSKDSKMPFLFLDKNYVIQQITPEAAQFFQKKPADLLNGHLFDLAPEPSLMQAIEKGEATKLLRPFLSYPSLLVSLESDLNGTMLFLENTQDPGTAQKH